MTKFKSYKNWINEKFVEDSDPIQDMGIGLYSNKNFNNEQQFCEFMMLAIPGILKLKAIPKDILNNLHLINDKHFHQLDYFVEKYISFKGIPTTQYKCEIYAWNSIISRYLEKNGY